MKTEAGLDEILTILSNPIRRQVIGFLSEKGSLTFTELMESCGLDIFNQCGLMDYHLKVLLESKVLKKGETYELTEFGKRIAEFLDTVQNMKVGEKRMTETEYIPNIRIERFQKEHVEAAVSMWMRIFGLDSKYIKKGIEHFQHLVFGVGSSVCFVAIVEDKIAGFLEGEQVKLGSFCETYGVLGYVHGRDRSWIAPEFGKLELQKYIFAKLVEVFSDCFKSLDAYGLFSPDIAPEMNKFDPVLRKVLEEQGFHVQNITYEMRKDFKLPCTHEPGKVLKKKL